MHLDPSDVNRSIPNRIPVLGQQPNQEQVAKAHIMQAINQMAGGMYVQVATAQIATKDPSLNREIDAEQLRELARTCHKAAVAYFEGLGVIQSPPCEKEAE